MLLPVAKASSVVKPLLDDIRKKRSCYVVAQQTLNGLSAEAHRFKDENHGQFATMVGLKWFSERLDDWVAHQSNAREGATHAANGSLAAVAQLLAMEATEKFLAVKKSGALTTEIVDIAKELPNVAKTLPHEHFPNASKDWYVCVDLAYGCLPLFEAKHA